MTVVIAVTSDLHCGGTTALCPNGIPLDDGGTYLPSKAQKWLWQSWNSYWDRVEEVRKAHKGSKLYEVFNGDLIDGAHHHTTQIVSENPNPQAAILNAAMGVPLSLKPNKMFIVRGTEAHVGHSASAEERIADGLRRDKRPIEGDPETGTASWWHLRMDVEGVYLDVTHHGRTGQREHTRGGAAVLHAHDILLSYVKRGERVPDLCLRAHYHRFNDSYEACPVRVITSGAWQLGTGFVHKVAADTMADIGGLIIVVKDGEYTVEKVKYQASRGPIWKAAA